MTEQPNLRPLAGPTEPPVDLTRDVAASPVTAFVAAMLTHAQAMAQMTRPLTGAEQAALEISDLLTRNIMERRMPPFQVQVPFGTLRKAALRPAVAELLRPCTIQLSAFALRLPTASTGRTEWLVAHTGPPDTAARLLQPDTGRLVWQETY